MSAAYSTYSIAAQLCNRSYMWYQASIFLYGVHNSSF